MPVYARARARVGWGNGIRGDSGGAACRFHPLRTFTFARSFVRESPLIDIPPLALPLSLSRLPFRGPVRRDQIFVYADNTYERGEGGNVSARVYFPRFRRENAISATQSGSYDENDDGGGSGGGDDDSEIPIPVKIFSGNLSPASSGEREGASGGCARARGGTMDGRGTADTYGRKIGH